MAMTSQTMRCFGITKSGGVDTIHELQMPIPNLHPDRPHDMLVRVTACAMNPVDYKIRQGGYGVKPTQAAPRILGWDGCGIVLKCGSGCTKFKTDDRIYFFCDITRQGCNSECCLVDERSAAIAPKTLSDTQAAALPLTALTAWEAMEDCMGLTRDHKVNANKSMLILPGASGVGSIAIQLAKHVFGVGKVIGTGSRKTSRDFALKMGADDVIDAREGIADEFDRHHLDRVDYVLNCMPPDMYLKQYGRIGRYDCRVSSVLEGGDLNECPDFFMKRMSLCFESVNARFTHNVDLYKNHERLTWLARMVDEGMIRSTCTRELSMDVGGLREAHRESETGTCIGKTTLKWHSDAPREKDTVLQA